MPRAGSEGMPLDPGGKRDAFSVGINTLTGGGATLYGDGGSGEIEKNRAVSRRVFVCGMLAGFQYKAVALERYACAGKFR